MSIRPMLTSKGRIESQPTMETIPDTPTGSTNIGETAVFRRSGVSIQVPNAIVNEQPMLRLNPHPIRPLSRVIQAKTVTNNLFPIQNIQKQENTSFGYQAKQNEFMAHHPLDTAIITTTTKENVAFVPDSSQISKLHGIKKVISETVNTAQVIPQLHHPNDITVYEPTPAAVKAYARKNVQIREGFCYKISNCFARRSNGIQATDNNPAVGKRCCPCWLLAVVGILALTLLTALGIAIYKNYSYQNIFGFDNRCRQGWHYLDGKCYSCPPGAVWDGANCIKNSIVVTGTSTSQLNSGGIINQNPNQNPQTNFNIKKTIIDSTITPQGIRRKIRRFNKSITQSDVNYHHLRYYF